MQRIPWHPLALVGALFVAVAFTSGATSLSVDLKVSQAFDNSAIARAGLAELGTTRKAEKSGDPGQCIVSAERWVKAAGGTVGGGGPVSTYTSAGAQEVSSNDAQPGDIIQYTHTGSDADTNWANVHTVVVVKNYGNGHFDIVQSNWGSPGLVTEDTDWAPNPYPGLTARVWRFGSVPSSDSASPQGVTGGGGASAPGPPAVTSGSPPQNPGPLKLPDTPICGSGQELVGGQCIEKKTGCEAAGFECSSNKIECRPDQERGSNGDCQDKKKCDQRQVADGHGGCKDKPQVLKDCRPGQERHSDGDCYDKPGGNAGNGGCRRGLNVADGECGTGGGSNNGPGKSGGDGGCPNGMVRVAPATDNGSGCMVPRFGQQPTQCPSGEHHDNNGACVSDRLNQSGKCPQGLHRDEEGVCRANDPRPDGSLSKSHSCPNGMVRVSPATDTSSGCAMEGSSPQPNKNGGNNNNNSDNQPKKKDKPSNNGNESNSQQQPGGHHQGPKGGNPKQDAPVSVQPELSHHNPAQTTRPAPLGGNEHQNGQKPHNDKQQSGDSNSSNNINNSNHGHSSQQNNHKGSSGDEQGDNQKTCPHGQSLGSSGQCAAKGAGKN